MSEQTIQFNKNKCIQLLIGTTGIYLTYLIIGIIQQWLIKLPYVNNQTGQQDRFDSTINYILFPHGLAFIIGHLYNRFTLKKQQYTHIPAKNAMMCAFFSLLGALTFNYAILWTSYPIVVTAKSCNLLSVILVGTLCSRVSDKKLKLTPQKIIVGITVSIGIILFKFFDPQAKMADQKKFEFIGLGVLLISLLADGFLPDFQAQIKSKYNPRPIQMMTQINKWVAIFCGIYVIASGEPFKAIQFSISHPLFGYHLMILSVLSAIGHFIIYRMIKIFKQHIVPFVITTRKIFTVCISLVFYNHKTSFGQILGILIVLGVVIFQFLSQLYIKNQTPPIIPKQIILNNQQEQTAKQSSPQTMLSQRQQKQ